jgi:hypothetical protein
MELNLVSVKNKTTGKVAYYGVDDRHYDAMLASGGSNLDDEFEWNWLGQVEVSEEILGEEGYFPRDW